MCFYFCFKGIFFLLFHNQGYFLLMHMAEKVGVEVFDKFLASYLSKHKGTLVTSEVSSSCFSVLFDIFKLCTVVKVYQIPLGEDHSKKHFYNITRFFSMR